MDAAVDIEALVRQAHLTGADEAAADDAVGGGVEIGVVEDQQRILAAEFNRRGNQPGAACVATMRPVGVLPVKSTASDSPISTGPSSAPSPVTTCSISRGRLRLPEKPGSRVP